MLNIWYILINMCESAPHSLAGTAHLSISNLYTIVWLNLWLTVNKTHAHTDFSGDIVLALSASQEVKSDLTGYFWKWIIWAKTCLREHNESKKKYFESKTVPNYSRKHNLTYNFYWMYNVRIYYFGRSCGERASLRYTSIPCFWTFFVCVLLMHMWPYGVTKNSNYVVAAAAVAVARQAMVFCGMLRLKRR